MSNIKSLLKGARQALSDGLLEKAVELCKSVLESDDGNYTALVFLGAAYEKLGELQSAENAYKTAIGIKDEEILAWKGLHALYEHHANIGTRDDRLKAARRLLTFSASDDEKSQELILVIIKFLFACKDYSKEVVQEAEDYTARLKDPVKKNTASVKIAAYLIKSKLTSTDVQSKFRELVEGFLVEEIEITEHKDEILNSYIDVLSQLERSLAETVKMLHRILKTTSQMPKVCSFIATLKCYAMLLSLSEPVFPEVDSSSLSDALKETYNHLQHSPDLTTGLSVADTEPLAEAVRWLYNLLCGRRAVELLDLDYAQLHKVTEYNLSTPICLKQYEAKLTGIAQSLIITWYFKEQKFKEITDLKFDQTKVTAEARELIGQALVKEKQYEAADSLISRYGLEAVRGFLMYMREEYEQAFSHLSDLLKSNVQDHRVYLWLGMTCKHIPPQKQNATRFLLMAAKLEPKGHEAFLHLGFQYTSMSDKIRGLKCLQKSYSLQPLDRQSVRAYVECLFSMGKNSDALSVLKDATILHVHWDWPWAKLGMLHLEGRNFSEAILCFQHVLRVSNDDSTCWQGLAECYIGRGSYTSAIKAFEKVNELQPGQMYPLYQMAVLHQTTGGFTKSLELYRVVLQLQPDFVPALKGVGDIYLSLARSSLKQAQPKRALSYINEAVVSLYRVIRQDPRLMSVWKSLGDVLLLAYQLPSSLRVNCPLFGSGEQSEAMKAVERYEALAVGSRCYIQCLHLDQNCSYTWHDLAINCYYRYKIGGSQQLIDSAIKYAMKATTLDKSVASHYCLLGTLLMERDREDVSLAQHCLIRSINIESTAMACTNLAVLYMLNEDFDIAHEAFKAAQSTDPNYQECWIGHAIYAEMIAHHETMDLFRHSVTLGKHKEALIGYGNWVIQTVSDKSKQGTEEYRYSIEKTHAAAVATDALCHYCENHGDAQSWNAYSLLLERQGLLRSAKSALVKCISMAQSAGDPNLPAYHSNLARVLCSLGSYDKCLEELKDKKEKTAEDIMVSALAHIKMGEYREAFDCYSKLLELLADNDSRMSQIYACLGMVAVKCGDNGTAKTALLKSASYENASIHGMASLSSFALLTGDQELAVVVLNELEAKESEGFYLLKAKFMFYYAILMGDVKKARNSLLKALHMYPCATALKEELVKQSLGNLSTWRGAILRLCSTISKSNALYAVSNLSFGNTKPAFRRCQAVLHCKPDSAEGLLATIAGSSAYHAIEKPDVDGVTGGLISQLSYLDTKQLSASQTDWLTDVKLVNEAYHGNIVSGESNSSWVNRMVIAGVNNDVNSVVELLNDQPDDIYGLQMLIKLIEDNQLDDSVIEQYGVPSEPARNHIAMFYFQRYFKNPAENSADGDKFQALVRNVDTATARFLFALFNYYKSPPDKRFAKKLLQKVIEDESIQGSRLSVLAQNFLNTLEK